MQGVAHAHVGALPKAHDALVEQLGVDRRSTANRPLQARVGGRPAHDGRRGAPSRRASAVSALGLHPAHARRLGCTSGGEQPPHEAALRARAHSAHLSFADFSAC
ncbi:hypothetical protein KFE25_014038 [Diacronema lutheri]|uniref:Uncharacterized protein n=1 Tax=Diacronema lutheri TaxID=2081491 RepID=A0A8J5XK79_DIALT|nr:hypothetical protein KFE25_014038 [Diacronema lutheri]